MIAILGCWAVLAFVFYSLGWGARKALRVAWNRDTTGSLDGTLATGAVLATLYAETASLFMPLRMAALSGLLVACGGMAWMCRREMGAELRAWAGTCREGGVALWTGVSLFAALALFWTSSGHFGYDTYNYHGQAIRWLEEFGVVKGLGNLHTRFAYNSSFLCLQALFSFTWALGRPVQAVNGFLWFAAVSWCWAGLIGRGHEGVSGRVLKGAFFLLSSWDVSSMAGVSTDYPAMLAMAYACIKWNEGNLGLPAGRDRRERLVGLLGVFAASVKLSAGVLGLFWAKSAWGLATGRKWRRLAAYVAAGLIAVGPFVARNAVISGYLAYPVSSLDILDPDWKIPSIVAKTDAAAIRLYAREGQRWTYAGLGERPESWLPKWAKRFPGWMAWAAAIGAAGCLAWGVLGMGESRERWTGWVGLAGIAFGLSTAPSPRFGAWWAVMGLAYWVQAVAGCRLEKAVLAGRKRMADTGRWFFAVSCAAGFCHGEEVTRRMDGLPWGEAKKHFLLPLDYERTPCRMAWKELGGERFYYSMRTPEGPWDGDLNGYWGFPGTECRTTLERIEMRGLGLGDGFRVRTECKGLAYDFQGKLLSVSEAGWFGVDALTQLEGAVRAEPLNGGWWSQLGMARLETGDKEGAMAAWKQAVSVDSGQWSAMNNLAWLCAEEGRVAEARAWMDRAMENAAARQNAGVWDTEAAVRRVEGDEAGARAAEARKDVLLQRGAR